MKPTFFGKGGAFLVLSTSLSAAALADPSFTISPISISGANYISATSASSNGLLAGYAGFLNGIPNGPYVGVAGVTTDANAQNPSLTAPIWGGISTQVGQAHLYGINSLGVSVGDSYVRNATNTTTYTHAVVNNGGTLTDIGTLGGISSFAYGINDAGTVVGYSTTGSGSNHAYSYSGGTMTDIGTLSGGTFSQANAINANGTIVGTATTSGTSYQHAFKYQNGVMTDLGLTTGVNTTYGLAVSNNGYVAGYGVDSSFNNRAIADFGSGFQDLGYLYTTSSGARMSMMAKGVNSYGDVVGYTSYTGGARHAFLYQGGTLYDLNNYLPKEYFGWTIWSAESINDEGYIAATVLDSSSAIPHTRAALLKIDTVPEPSSVAGIAFLSLGFLRRRKNSNRSVSVRMD
ncbi:MAG: PEP-CTERM sorting domain-containing protein [Armatimonadetes bacterium]|nr:PEP-CTERM sorting domain-containing protein [Armatimonadota bacterium]